MIISDGAEIRGISEWSATHARIMPQRLFMGNNSHFPVLRLENMGQEDGRYFLSYILPSWSCRQEIKSLFKRGYGSARLDIAPAPFAVRLWGGPKTSNLIYQNCKICLTLWKAICMLHPSFQSSVIHRSVNRSDCGCIYGKTRRISAASATQIESRSLPLVALVRRRNCNREHQLLTRIFNW